MTSVDPLGTREALERQIALLAPVIEHLRTAANAPSPMFSDEWRGPAAEAAADFAIELQARLRIAEDAAHDTVRRLQIMARAVS